MWKEDEAIMLNRRRSLFIVILLVCALIYTLQYTNIAAKVGGQSLPQTHLWAYQKQSEEESNHVQNLPKLQMEENHVQFVQSENVAQPDTKVVPPINLQVYNGRNEEGGNKIKDYYKNIHRHKSTAETLKKIGVKIPENAYPLQQNQRVDTQTERTQVYIPNNRIVHLDFKGAPPKVEYLSKLFPLIKSLGATGVLLEWEDTLPYYGILSHIKAKNHYSKQEVAQIISLCKANNLDIIPLVQTFGHLEFVLKLQQWQHLREVPEVPQSLCPSLNDSLGLVKLLIDQTMSFHSGVSYLHVGCDEVVHIGECSRCFNKNKDTLFLQHVQMVATYVRDTYHVTPIIWDDMLRHTPAQDMKDFHLGELVEPMVWVYVTDVYRFISPNIWDKYSSVFPTIWSASAYKGAYGPSLYIVNVKKHLDNNLSWLRAMQNEQNLFSRGFQGITITGWQRYDHFANLCELLPAAIPSLVVTLLATSNGYFDDRLMKPLYEALKCMKTMRYHTYVDWDRDPSLTDKLAFCDFPGANFFRIIARLKDAETELNEYTNDKIKKDAWLQEYNVRRNFSSADRIDNILGDLYRIEHMFSSFVKSVQDSLSSIYDIYTISEWIELKIYPVLKMLKHIKESGEKLKKSKTWPVRPFPVLRDLMQYGFKINDTSKVRLTQL